MKRRPLMAIFALATLAVLAMPQFVRAAENVPFKGTISGNFTAVVIPPIGTFEGVGTGNATQLGAFSYEFPHTVNFGGIPPIGMGTYTFTAANGDTLTAMFVGSSTPGAPGTVFVTEYGEITGGSGRFRIATGEFTIMRLVDQINGTTTGLFEGTIVYGRSN